MAQLHVRNITPEFGAEVVGLDPAAELDHDSFAALRRAFDDRGVVLFRDLDIDQEFQDRVVRMLFSDERTAAAAGTADRPPFYVSNTEEGGNAPYGRLLFHTDMMWAEHPFQVLSLYGLQVEPGAATTTFTSATAAWDRLPPDLRERVDGLHALHVTGQQARENDDRLLQPIREREQSTITPIAYRHPRTGRTILYVSQMMTREIVELPHDESEALLGELFGYLYDPAHLYEHEWRNGDFVVFDNLAIQHSRGDVTPDGPVRTLRKVFAPIPVLQAEAPRFAETR